MSRNLPGKLLASLLFLLAFQADPADAQGPARLVGAWRYVQEVDSTADGHHIEYMPPEGFAGLLIYTAKGRMSAQILPDRPSVRPLADVLDLSTSYFGTYTVDWARKTVTHHLQGTLTPDKPMPTYVRGFEFRGDTLVLKGTWTHEGAPARFAVLWVRQE